jgi:hypothetical protein
LASELEALLLNDGVASQIVSKGLDNNLDNNLDKGLDRLEGESPERNVRQLEAYQPLNDAISFDQYSR